MIYLFCFLKFIYIILLFLASSPSPTEKDQASILAHMQMSLRTHMTDARGAETGLRNHMIDPRQTELNKNQSIIDTKNFMADGRQFPPPMHYMGMQHLSPWQLAAH